MHYKFALLLMLSAYCSILSAQSQTKQYRVHFKVDEYQLDDADRTMLNDIIKEYQRSRYGEINVSAHTDSDAGEAYNMKLSQNRAQAVIDYLTQHGIGPMFIASGWYGERKPDANNRSEEGKSENRRVDLQLRMYNFNTVGELLRHVAPPSVQTFTVSNKKENRIVGREGTIIVIPKDALLTKDGKPVTSDKVTVQLEEFLKPSDAAFQQLSTICDGRILESGGMFSIKAMADGEELILKKGKEINVELPSKSVQPGMELFTAVKTPEGITEWKATSKSFVAPRPAPQKQVPYARVIDTARLFESLARPDYSDFKKIEFTYAIPAFPVAPRKPYKPRKYVEPTAEKMYSWVSRVVLPASYIEKKVNAEKERLEKQYQTRMARYQPKQDRYLVAYAKYQRDSGMFEQEHGAPFHTWLLEQKRYNENCITAAEQQSFNRGVVRLVASTDSNAVPVLIKQYPWINNISTSTTSIYRNRFALLYIEMMLDMTLSEAIELNAKEFTAKNRSISLLKIPGSKDRKACVARYNSGEQTMNSSLSRLIYEMRTALIEKRAKAGVIDNETVAQVYATSLSSFGTYNCDRFSGTPPFMMATIRLQYQGDARVSFYIPSINGYIYANHNASGYYIDVPRNTRVKVVCVAYNDSKGLLCSVQEVRFFKDETITPELKNVKLDEMNRMLASL
jgi:hypothetical protein